MPNTHSSGAGEELARGFYRLGRWVDRARTPEEQRFHDGGQGQQRQSRRQERVRQWKAGTFVPAWKRDMENTAARMHGQSDIDREALRRLLNAGEPRTMSTIREGDDDGGVAPTSGAMPGLTHENRDEISEDRTSCSLSSVGPDDTAAGLGLEGVVPEPGVDPPHEPRSELSPGDASELPVPRPDRGEPWQPDGEPCVLPVQPRDRDDPVLPDRDAPVEASGCAGQPRDVPDSEPCAAQPRGDDPAIPAQPRDSGDPVQRDGEPPVRAPRWTRQQWDDWEAWEHKHGNEGDDVNMMQRTAMERDQEEDEADDPPSEGASSSNQPAGEAVLVVAPARPNLCLTLVEQQGLLDAGWPLHHVEHITMFAEYLEDTANQYGIEAAAWGNDGWGDALVMANATVELAQELIWDRLRDVRVVRPGDQAARGRVAVGWAGFQKQLGALHLEIMTEALRHQWLPEAVDDDGRRLPKPPFVRGDHNAWALARARTLARELVQRSRTLGAERRAEQARAGLPGDQGEPVAGREEDGEMRGDSDSGRGRGEESGEEEESDEQAMMELTPTEERLLEQRGLTDEARRHIRGLLVALEQLQGHGEGPEYRWGVMQLVRAWDDAVHAVSVIRDILQLRTTPMGCLPYFPAVREPRYGPLRTRVGSYMEEFRYMLLRCLSEEGGLRLRDMVAGGPRPHGGRSAPGAADETVQAMRPGRNTRRARRVSGVVPRGSRSRSRTPPSEPGSLRASSSTDVVESMASNAGRCAGVASGPGEPGLPPGEPAGPESPPALPPGEPAGPVPPSALPPGDPSGPALPGAVGAGTGELVGVLPAVPSGAASGQVAAVDVRDLPERDPLAVCPHVAHVIPEPPGGRARPEPREDCAVPGPALPVPGQSGTEVHLSLGAENPGRPELSGDVPPVGLPLCEQPPCEQPSELLVGPALPALPGEVPLGELPVHGLGGSGVNQPVGAECAGCSDPPREPTPRVRPPPREQPSHVLPRVPGDPEADVPDVPVDRRVSE